MIVEALTWLTTPAPSWARKGGYLKELIAIQARYKRCRAAWASHLDNTRDEIENAAQQCLRKQHAVIYGSGLLLDIPLSALADQFERVTLVDVAHLRPTRRQARRFKNVFLTEMDIAGVVNGILLGVAKGADTLPQPTLPALDDPETVDLVVSPNLLTQLPLTPCQLLVQHLNLSEAELRAFSRRIMQTHLDHLAGLNAVRCLIAETAIQHVDAQGQILHERDPLHGLTLPGSDRSWAWTVAPLGEVSPSYAVRNIVSASTSVPQPAQ